MARRKRVLDDGDDSDSVDGSDNADLDLENDLDLREERALFQNPYAHKRRKKDGKEDTLYGIFAEESDDDTRHKNPTRPKRSDWTKAPSFVTGDQPVKLDDAMVIDTDDEVADDADGSSDDLDAAGEDDGSEGENEHTEDAEYSDESKPSRPPSPRVRLEADEDEEVLGMRPRVGGIDITSFSRGDTKTSGYDLPTAFTGMSRGGIGSKKATVEEVEENEGATAPTPSTFAQKSHSFGRSTSSTPKPVDLPPEEMVHFRKIQNSFGARMLAKMGWQAGTGLGAEGSGIIIPIESKLRPQKMGIAFNNFGEKTKQSKLEAKRRGEVVSDDEDEKTKKYKKKAKEQHEKRADAWKRPKKVKLKIEHKTYEQILEEAGEQPAPSGIGQIIDATGAVPREVSSLAEVNLNSWAPSNDPTRIPEVRHNIRLISDACKSDLDGLAREARALQERKKFVDQEDLRLRKKVEDEAELIARLQQIQLVANDISDISRNLASLYEVSLEAFSPMIQKLVNEYASEYEKYGLDEIVVGAIAPVMRRMIASWKPLDDPLLFLQTFRGWRRALKINEQEVLPEYQEVDVYGAKTSFVKPIDVEKPMTPFESLLWNVWLPKVRTSINNDWSAEDSQPAVKLYETWSSFLPPFIRDNLLDQLILPKVQKAVANWNTVAKVSLQTIVFPWLPHVGLRMEDLLGDARRKIKNLLRNWTISDSIPVDLSAWKDVFDSGEWDAMLLKYIVPKLGASLRNDFRINPRDQKMETLHQVFAWSELIRNSIFTQILEIEFFPKWLDVLHIWLIQPRVNFEEVAQWYSFWKETFPETIRNLPAISRGFTRGLQLMNKAIEYGPDAPTKLTKPDYVAEISKPNSPVRGTQEAEKISRPSARTHEITFRSIVEEFSASHNLLFIPTGKAHERSRMPLFRVSRTADGRKGLLVYILDDAVWAPKEDTARDETAEFKAITLEEMILRATT